MPASQLAGFIRENEIRVRVFRLPRETNHTGTHDIACSDNRFDPTENVSVKTTVSRTLCCGDLLRFFDYDFGRSRNTIICIQHKQVGEFKVAVEACEIRYTKAMHQYLFGTVTRGELEAYVRLVKTIPHGRCDAATRTTYKAEAKRLKDLHRMEITLNPKVNSSSQRRVQCTITRYNVRLSSFISQTMLPKGLKGPRIRTQRIARIIHSPKRVRKPRKPL